MKIQGHHTRSTQQSRGLLKTVGYGLDARSRRREECNFRKEQQGSRKGRGTADEMYVLSQMSDKRLEVQGSMALGFFTATNDSSRNKVQKKLLSCQLYLEYVLYDILKVYSSEKSVTLSNLPISCRPTTW